jgi:hypothetical protein
MKSIKVWTLGHFSRSFQISQWVRVFLFWSAKGLWMMPYRVPILVWSDAVKFGFQ